MCVAQINSYQDEVLAMIRKAQSRGLQVLNIEYDEEVLKEEGTWIIETVTIVGACGPFNTGCLGAREWIGEWLYKNTPQPDNGFNIRKMTFCN